MAAFAFTLALLLVAQARSTPHPPYPRGQVIAAVLRDPNTASVLAHFRWTEHHVIALDETHWRATFTDGPRQLLDVSVGPRGTIDAAEVRVPGRHPPGSTIVWTKALLVLLAGLFALATTVRPLRSLRNLDALVLGGGFTATALLNDARLPGPQVFVGAACLAYLAARCAQVGFRPLAREPEPDPVYRRLFRSADVGRTMRMIAAATLIAGVVITVTSTGASDVALAGLAGATKLIHGQLPYGHLGAADVVHGDTYPLLTYVAYAPFAAISPVRNSFDSLDGALWLNAIALVAAAGCLYRFAGRGERGVVAALAWLAAPGVFLAASSGGNDVPTAVLVAAALMLFARPVLSSSALALATTMKIVPGIALLVWVPRLRGRALTAACAATVAVFVAALAALVIIGGTGALGDTWDALRFQFERGSWYSVWQQTGTRSLQIVFQAAVFAFAAVAGYEAWRLGARQLGVRRAAALAGALVALVQIGASYWTYAYLPWLLPFILVALFPPAPPRSPQPAPPVP